MKLILASASPRRIEMFRNNGFDPEVIPSDFNEHIPFSMTPAETVMYLSLMKGLSVQRMVNDNRSGEESIRKEQSAMIVSADTIVVDNNTILGKPKDEKDAFSMLSALSDRSHHVLTGVTIITGSCIKCFYETSEVFFKDIPENELRAYVATPEPYDKAGGYAIQGTFEKYIDHIEGDYDNVVGLPLTRLKQYIGG